MILGPRLKLIIVGATNTLLTYSIFIALTLFVKTWLAFTLAYALGFLWTVLMSSEWVFGSRTVPKNILEFGVIHLLLFLIGQAVVLFATIQGIQNRYLLSAIIIALSAPLSFLAGKFVFTRNQR